MSLRGSFTGVFDAHGLRDTPKRWHISRLDTAVLWYELVVNPLNERVDLRSTLSSDLSSAKKAYEEFSSRRFVYFVCTRPRVRIADRGGVRLTAFRRRLRITLEVGAHRSRRRLVIPREVFEITIGGRAYLPIRVASTPTSLIIHYPNGVESHQSIHNFLRGYGINLGLASKVEYVGYTKNPHTRPLNSEHRGLCQAAYKAGQAGEDVFIYYNTFHVRVMSSNPAFGVEFLLSNAMIGEVDEDTEGQVVESCWIAYFKPSTQAEMEEREAARFSTLKEQLYRRHGIVSLDVEYDPPSPSEYFTLFSDAQPRQSCHSAHWDLPEDADRGG